MTYACRHCGAEFDDADDRNEHQFSCRSLAAPKPPKRKDTGGDLEKLVRGSVKALKPHGLSLTQASPRTVGRHGRGGNFVGKVTGKGALDFNGDYQGQAVYFDAKSCAVLTSFSLDRLAEHQVERVRTAHERGAVGFFLVEFSTCATGHRYFVLTWPVLKSFWERQGEPGAPKSIPFPTFLGHCPEVTRAGKVLDLIAAVKAVVARRDGGAA